MVSDDSTLDVPRGTLQSMTSMSFELQSEVHTCYAGEKRVTIMETTKNTVPPAKATDPKQPETQPQPTETKSEIETSMLQLALGIYFSTEQLSALGRKYSTKWKAAPKEMLAHKLAYPSIATENGVMYVVTQLIKEADDKIAADKRDAHIANTLSEVTSFQHDEVLTARQVRKNEDATLNLKEIADEIGDNHAERVKILS